MKFIIPEHRYGALSVPGSGPEERRAESCNRLAHLAALDSERLPMAMAFLSGYHPRIFDAILDAVEPYSEPGIRGDAAGQGPFCVKCGASVGVFLAHGKGVPALPRRPYLNEQAQALQG